MSSTLSVKDVCERYGVSEHTVLGWIAGGELRALNVGRKPGSKKPRWRITPEALETFEALRTATPTVRATRRRTRHQPDVIEFYK